MKDMIDYGVIENAASNRVEMKGKKLQKWSQIDHIIKENKAEDLSEEKSADDISKDPIEGSKEDHMNSDLSTKISAFDGNSPNQYIEITSTHQEI